MNFIKNSLLSLLFFCFLPIAVSAMEAPEGKKEKESEKPIQRKNKRKVIDLTRTEEKKEIKAWEPRAKKVKAISSLTKLSSQIFFKHGLQQDNFPELIENAYPASEAQKVLKEQAETLYPHQTLLHVADTELAVRNLCELGLDPNKRNYKGQTAINALIDRGNFDGAHYLLERFGTQLDLESVDEAGFDPLHNAIRCHEAELAATIWNIVNTQGKLAIVLMRKNNQKMTSCELAIKNGLVELVARLSVYDASEIYENIMNERYGPLNAMLLQCAWGVAIYADNAVAKLTDLLQRGVNKDALYYSYGAGRGSLLTLVAGFPEKIDILKFLLHNNALVDIPDGDGDTALMFAIITKNEEAIRELLKAGAAIDIIDNKGESALSVAVDYFPQVLPWLLDAGSLPVDSKTKNGVTFLCYALQRNETESSQVLLDLGAKVNNVNDNGVSPLMVAKQYCPQMVKTLQKLGAVMEPTDSKGRTALILAIHYKKNDMVKILIAAGANVNARSTDGITPLMAAAVRFPDYIDELIKAGALLEDKGPKGCTALLFAINYKNDSGVINLINAGADVTVRDDEGNGVLEYVRKYMPSYVKFLKKIISEKQQGRTVKAIKKEQVILSANDDPHQCLYDIHDELQIKNLVAQGLDLNRMNDEGQTALNELICHCNLDGARILLKYYGNQLDLETVDNAGFDPLQYSIKWHDDELAKDIILILRERKKIEVLQRVNKDGLTPCQLAVKENRFSIIPLLNKYHEPFAIYNYIMNGKYGQLDARRLQCALGALIGNANCNEQISYLIGQGVNIDELYYTSSRKHTMLMHCAAQIERIDTVKLLLQHTVLINRQNEEGHNALMFAILAKNEHAVKAIIEAGATANSVDKSGNAPLYYAVKCFPAGISILIKHGARVESRDKSGNRTYALVESSDWDLK